MGVEGEEGGKETEVRRAMECDNITLFSTEAADFKRKMHMIQNTYAVMTLKLSIII